MWIVEFDGPPSWAPDASKTGESTKCPWVGAVRLIACAFCTLPSFAPIKRQRTQRSTSTISRKNRGLWTVYKCTCKYNFVFFVISMLQLVIGKTNSWNIFITTISGFISFLSWYWLTNNVQAITDEISFLRIPVTLTAFALCVCLRGVLNWRE